MATVEHRISGPQDEQDQLAESLKGVIEGIGASIGLLPRGERSRHRHLGWNVLGGRWGVTGGSEAFLGDGSWGDGTGFGVGFTLGGGRAMCCLAWVSVGSAGAARQASAQRRTHPFTLKEIEGRPT